MSQIPYQLSDANNRTTAESTTVNFLPSTTNPTNIAVANLMDIDDDLHANNTTNGFSNHGTVTHPSTTTSSSNQISNGHSVFDDDSSTNLVVENSLNSNGCQAKTTEIVDGMDYDGCCDSSHAMDIETTSDVQKKSNSNDNDQLLVRILQFGRELHALKQQLTTEYGENPLNDKMLQVCLFFLQTLFNSLFL
jgi:hypothetical protein